MQVVRGQLSRRAGCRFADSGQAALRASPDDRHINFLIQSNPIPTANATLQERRVFSANAIDMVADYRKSLRRYAADSGVS